MKKIFLLRLSGLLILAIFLFAGCAKRFQPGGAPTIVPTQAPQQEAASIEPSRGYRTSIKGDGEDVVTLMIYMCGSDLETDAGFASADINEILYADIGENVNIILETGGAKDWRNSVISNKVNQRYQATNSGLEHLEDIGLKDMTKPETLSDFIQFATANYPADRYGLILWDHGSGTLGGFGYDEHFPEEDAMTIAGIDQALEQGGVALDFLGFDACLMATAETAFMAEKHADYLIASQMTEPGLGWYYTGWITALSKNTSFETKELAKGLIDEYISACVAEEGNEEATLSVMDLTFIRPVFDELYQFFSAAEEQLIQQEGFAQISKARQESRMVAETLDHVDITYLTQKVEGVSAGNLQEALGACVVYNQSTVSHNNGLNIYFPYTDLGYVEDVVEIYEAIGIDQPYISFITTFANIMLGGQAYADGGSGGGFDMADWEGYGWVDQGLISDYQGYYGEWNYDDETLEIVEQGEDFVLMLTDDAWEMITTIELQVLVDDGEGYLDLGSDNIYDFDDNGNLLIDFDNTWVAINEQVVSFYMEEEVDEDGFWYTYGAVPIFINSRLADLILFWDDDNPYGYVAGVRYVYDGPVMQKGLIPLQEGDKIEFLCDYYDYGLEYDDTYIIGKLTVKGELEVSYQDVGSGDCLVYYMLTDIYGNTYTTEPLLMYEAEDEDDDFVDEDDELVYL